MMCIMLLPLDKEEDYIDELIFLFLPSLSRKVVLALYREVVC